MTSTVPVQYPIPENKRILAYKAMLAKKMKNRIENATLPKIAFS